MASNAPPIGHVGVKHMINLQQGTEMWKKYGKWGKQVPAEWKPTIGLLVHGIMSQDQGVVFKTKKEDILARGFLESVMQQAEVISSAKGETRLRDFSEKQRAAKLTTFTNQLYKAGLDEGFGVHGAAKVWKEIVKAKNELFEDMKIGGKDMTDKNKSNHVYHYDIAFELEALNAVVRKALLMEKHDARMGRIKFVVFVALLIIAASIIVYSQKKIYRFARTQFRKIMDTWRRFRGRPEIYNTLEKLESSGRVISPGSNKEIDIHDMLRTVEMENASRIKTSQYSSLNTMSHSSRRGPVHYVAKKSPKFKWIEFDVEKPHLKPTTKKTPPLKPTTKRKRRR